MTRLDPVVDFVWTYGSPAPGIDVDTFSARWVGQIQPLFSETYTFYTESDDGVRLWVNGVPVVANWTDHAMTENSGTIALVAGQRYDIRMEFYENFGAATARLLWSSASTAKSVIPAALLYPQLSTGSTPFGGTPAVIPGTLEAEEFDEGGEGIAYHDLTDLNQGGQFRSTGVDIETAFDVGGGFNVGWMAAGEWLAYTIEVANAGQFALDARVAANGAGGTFHVEVNGADVTGPLTIPDTGGWHNWTTISKAGVPLTAGRQILRIVLDGNGPAGFGNINYLRLTATPTSTTPSDVVIYATDIAPDGVHGAWAFVNDPT